MIRDRNECGTNSTKVREKLTSKGSVLTLDKAVEEQHGYEETVAAPPNSPSNCPVRGQTKNKTITF